MPERIIPLQAGRDIEKEIDEQSQCMLNRYIVPGYVLIGSHAYLAVFGKRGAMNETGVPRYQSPAGELEFLLHPTDENQVLVLPSNKNFYTTLLQLANAAKRYGMKETT